MNNSERHTIPQSTIPLVERQLAPGGRLVGEWQQRGPETLSGHGVRKLRLSFASTPSALSASATG